MIEFITVTILSVTVLLKEITKIDSDTKLSQKFFIDSFFKCKGDNLKV